MKKKSARPLIKGTLEGVNTVSQLLSSQNVIDTVENLKINLHLTTHILIIARDRQGKYHVSGKLPVNLESLRVLTRIENTMLFPNENKQED